MADFYDGARVIVDFDSTAVQPASCAWSRTQTDGFLFAFPTFQPGELLTTVVDRWLSLWELYLRLDRLGSPIGRVVLNFNDAGVEPGLAFCGDRPEHILIPDHAFFKSRGYAQAREYFDAHPQPWDQRSEPVFWRGSSVGQKHHAILDMPRARLCQIGHAAADGWFDVGITDLFHIRESDAAQLRAANLVKDRVSWKQLNRYRFHIDIDGHANAYAALFRKFLSGGPVLKVTSPDRYRQWYYDRLKPWENFVPVRSDLSDLLEVTAYCREHDDLGQRIAQNGRELALSMSFEKEFAAAVETVRKAFGATAP